MEPEMKPGGVISRRLQFPKPGIPGKIIIVLNEARLTSMQARLRILNMGWKLYYHIMPGRMYHPLPALKKKNAIGPGIQSSI